MIFDIYANMAKENLRVKYYGDMASCNKKVLKNIKISLKNRLRMN